MILLTGGSGKLGNELQKLLNVYAPSSEDFDILSPGWHLEKPEMIIHAAAYTDVGKAENDYVNCFRTNVIGTENVQKMFPGVPFVFISTEYAQKPVNVYGLTKLLAEESLKEPYLIIRTLFKPRPFPWDSAYIDQYTYGDYVDNVAMIIAQRIKSWDRKTSNREITNTGKKSMYELAKRTKPDVKEGSVEDFKAYPIPRDYE